MPSIFLSYSSDDREMARSISRALTDLGLEVWLDESELGGGDAWDQKIRRQIRECDYFMPIISAHTEARHEGYFRREWRLAVERTLDMVDDHLFLLPVVIDETEQSRARVPEKFLEVQWLRLPEGRSTPALEALCRRIVAGVTAEPPASRRVHSTISTHAPGPGASAAARVRRDFPPFPTEEAGQRVRFGAQVVGWGFQSAWIAFQRLPRWVRIVVYCWVSIALLARGCSEPSSEHRHASSVEDMKRSAEDLKKLKSITDEYKAGSAPIDWAKLGARLEEEFSDEDEERPAHPPILAIAFAVPDGDPAARRLAETAFAQTFGQLEISHHGQLGFDADPAPSRDAHAALERARTQRANYVVYGAVDAQPTPPLLTVNIARVADGALLWTHAYPAGTDPVAIASEVSSHLPSANE